ncbi:hypothetical protein KUV80_09770 [Fictibacillus nanhaiensis]|uniref:hypothetical protein n=1 Tax=Fictibacillus nanhaiensis TaxID=742169 RepID=UPI001C95C598|nr:hypothetical protein [Fictibacillus nanhaiensis]MBY6036943.1 hypothetical protein [Fictibacillus nanhaiensis]
MEPHINGIFDVLKEHVNDLVKEDMDSFKRFFMNNADSNITMYDYAKEIRALYQSNCEGKPINYQTDFIGFKNVFRKFFELNCQRSIWLLEYALSRRVVKRMLLSKDKTSHLNQTQKEVVNKVVQFLYGCDIAEKNLAYTVPSFLNKPLFI